MGCAWMSSNGQHFPHCKSMGKYFSAQAGADPGFLDQGFKLDEGGSIFVV